METTPAGSTPVPDPTTLTTEAVDRASDQWRRDLNNTQAIIETRLAAMDAATMLRLEAIVGIRPQTERLIAHAVDVTTERFASLRVEIAALHGLMDEKFASVGKQFAERDTRSEREGRDNKLAVDAAFAAQEKQAKAQNESNTEAIRKSETATSETIKTNGELAMASISAQGEKIDELNKRLTASESRMQGVAESRRDHYSDRQAGMSSLGAALVGISLLIGMASIITSILISRT